MPFQIGVGVFRTLPLVAVGKQQDQPARPLPLGCGADDELVDDDLRPVRKVCQLGLPEDELHRIGSSHLEAQDRRLGEHAVVGAELWLCGREVVSWERTDCLRTHVVPDCVAMGRCSPGAVLAAQPYGCVFEQKRAEGEKLCGGPVDISAFPHGLEDLRKPAGDLRVEGEPVGNRRERLCDPDEDTVLHVRGDAVVAVGVVQSAPEVFKGLHAQVGVCLLDVVIRPLEPGLELGGEGIRLPPRPDHRPGSVASCRACARRVGP